MLKEFVQDVLLRNRPERLPITFYGRYKYLSKELVGTYNDGKQCYEVKTLSGSTTVRSSNAFIDYIKKELSRRDNSAGKYATVHVNTNGGEFCADDNFNEGKCTYERLHSEQYETLKFYNDKVLDHEEFLIMLQKLKPSIENFPDLWQRCSKIRIVGRSEVNSTPVFSDDGEAESGYQCTYRLSDGTDEDVTLPAEFFVTLPFVKAGTRMYTYHVELLFMNTRSSSIEVRVQVTDWETNEERAIIDEGEEIKAALTDCNDLLVLADF